MKQHGTSAVQGFTLGEMLIAIAVGSVILAAIFSASVALQKSFNAADNFFYTHLQQVRIIDYLSRDVKRSYIVHTVANPQTVSCTIPNYVIQTGDSDAGSGNVNVGTRRTPLIKTSYSSSGLVVNYGRAVSDGVTTSGGATLTSATANFTATDVGAAITGIGIPTGTTIQSRTNATTITMSSNATASTTNDAVTIVPQSTVVYSISGNSILRTENNVVTTIASATDQLVPTSIDTQLTNTEFLTSNVTFLPIFYTGGNATIQNTERAGTTVYATAYLRNLRRGN